jgi:hypothetical protein
MATSVHPDARAQTETTDEDLISNGFHEIARNGRAQTPNEIPEIAGAYLRFEP